MWVEVKKTLNPSSLLKVLLGAKKNATTVTKVLHQKKYIYGLGRVYIIMFVNSYRNTYFFCTWLACAIYQSHQLAVDVYLCLLYTLFKFGALTATMQ